MVSTYAQNFRAPLPDQGSQEDTFVPIGKSVASYAYREESNQYYRPYMEDRYCAVDNFMGVKTQGYFGLFDGHGGAGASEMCKQQFHKELQNTLSALPNNVQQALDMTFLRIDDQLRVIGAFEFGTTATVCLIREEAGQRVMYIANVGDTKACVVHASGVERLSYEHKGTDQNEYQRITRAGGLVLLGRVSGTLAVTRALGDHQLKTEGCIANPTINRRIISYQDIFIVLASDGLWDVVEEIELKAYEHLNANEIAKKLVELALERGSKDNISVLVICL